MRETPSRPVDAEIVRDREPLISLVLYHLFKWSIVSPVLHTYFRGRIYGAENVPKQGRLLVVSNHASDFDPPLLSCAIGRPVAYMAKEELFKVPVLKQAITAYGAYPVKRGTGDRAAMKAAMASVESGWATGVFLDGTRTADGRIADPKLGAAWIAAKTNSPLIPVSLWGTHEIFKPGSSIPRPVPITIRIGEVIEAPKSSDRAELEAITQRCAIAIHALHDLGR
ncbi:lysophospholipid acyltransferase family protein [Leptolyngbya sp. NIES-2104]|uniref:lysophospholipid acyltransferase family protein n=1 Tax=Leptolyngbya sp. NIES-2104 TaxID=1552121 RepID=UPI0006EC5F93|nr:lysophospholipid acyltransferase family protein [Leptolyngbya sp. NIES-2104]GAP97708.1 1-acyl-sn-glycerol-3-phosphate acyltransferase [Leptolyngbya sp. NIES-2104]